MNYNISTKSKFDSNGGAINNSRGLLGSTSSSSIGILLVIILSAILVSVKPDYFKYLFKTVLGNLFMIVLIIIISLVDIKWGIGIAAVSFIIYQAFQISCVQKDGFSSYDAYYQQKFHHNDINDKNNNQANSSNNNIKNSNNSNNSNDKEKPETGITKKQNWGLIPEGYPIPKTKIWPQYVIDDFIEYQKKYNPNIRFDLDIVQKQATAAEAKVLLKTGKWPWSSDIIRLYQDTIAHNNVINTEPEISSMNARAIYNQRAIVELLSWNSKEGSFLTGGSVIGHTDGLPDNINNIVRCGIDKSNGSMSMQKIIYNKNGDKTITNINNSDIPKEVNGFKFLKGECNPCGPLSDPANYSCPFSLNIGNGNEVSAPWQHLWGINSEGDSTHGLKKTDKLSPENISSMIDSNKGEFPLLSQLRDELMKGFSYIDCSIKPSKTSKQITSSIFSSSDDNSNSYNNSYSNYGNNTIKYKTGISKMNEDKKIYYGTKNTF
jgi:hypothetical protein